MSVALQAKELHVGYDDKEIISGLDLEIAEGSFTIVIGPNACGKSTLLRALARLIPASRGEVLLDGRPIRSRSSKQVARQLAFLPQSVETPSGIGVLDLVARGRFPHQHLLQQWSSADERAVEAALSAAGVAELRDRGVDELSGGQRQRVLLAMVSAQETPLLLLDEPTTYLDISHQIDMLDLCRRLNREHGVTVVAVLHDLNHAARYATDLVVMSKGALVGQGRPGSLIDAALIEDVFGLPCTVVDDPVTGTPLVVPLDDPR